MSWLTRFDTQFLKHLITPALGLPGELQAGGGGVEEEAGGVGAGGHHGK